MSTTKTTIIIWLSWGGINSLFAMVELFYLHREQLKKVGAKELLLTLPLSVIRVMMSSIILGPLSTFTNIKFSKALHLYKDFMGHEVMADLYGTGRVYKMDIDSAFDEKPKVWVKFHSYPEPILITFINLTIIDNENY